MKFLIGALIVIGCYLAGLFTATNSVMNTLQGLQADYSYVSASADQWAAGKTNTPLAPPPRQMDR